MKLSFKFSVPVILLLVVSLGAAAWFLAHHQSQAIDEQVLVRAKTVLDFGESCREYAREKLSPAVHNTFDTPDRKAPLVFEADSATFVVRGTFEALNKRAPEYTLHEAALNPLNLDNLADAEESSLIARFRADRSLHEVKDYRRHRGKEQFFVARPIVVEAKCLQCHESAETAPKELVAFYGSEHGYGWVEGDVNSVLIVAVPTEDIRAQQEGIRWKVFAVFAVLAFLLVVTIPLLFEQLVNRRLRNAGRVMEQIRGTLLAPPTSGAGQRDSPPPAPGSGQFAKPASGEHAATPGITSRRLADHRLPVDSTDELGVLAGTFNRMADAVRDAHGDLEERVSRRTAELSRSNRALQDVKRDLETNALRLTESLEELRKSEARARAVLATALDAVITIDHLGRVIEFNPAAEEMFGYRRDGVMGRELSEFIIPPELRDAHRRGLERYLATGQSTMIGRRVEVTALHAIGRHFPIDLALTVIAEKPPLFTAIVRDISERKESAQILARVNTRLRTILDAATQVSIIATDATGLITDFNSGAERMYGYRAEEMVGKQTPAILHDPIEIEECARALSQRYGVEIQGFAAVFIEQVRRGGHVEREWTYFRKDGSRLKAHLSVTPRFDPDGSLVGYLGIAIDVTERARAAAELLKAKEAAEATNRAKSDFLANMSHEIRTPIHGIMGMTELALDTELTAEQRDYLEMVKGSADALLAVINDVLDFSKIEAGRLDLDTVPFRLRDVIADVLKPLGVRAYAKGLELALHVAPDVPNAVVGDPARLRQVLLNLVGNAVKFTEKGEVVVEIGMQNSECRSQNADDSASSSSILTSAFCILHFSVRDTGIGIPADKLAAIFEPFVQADSSTTRKYGGTGLGLTISSRIVTIMNGRVWAESAVDKGSTFHFTVRLGLTDAEIPELRPVELRDRRALVVDDNATNRKILAEALTSWEMKATTVESAPAALDELERAAAHRVPYDVVLLDACMPEMDGFDLVRALQRRPHLSTAALMMLSSADRHGDAVRCRELGISLYLTKPVKQSDLREALRTLLHREIDAQQPNQPESSRAPATRPLRVLVAEDNPVNQRLAVGLLTKRGHQVVVVDNGAAAVRAFGDGAFDLVLMDLHMPEMGGFEATAAIRALEKGTGRRVPILAVTARAMKGDREECLKADMDGYLSKPVQSWQLDQAIASVQAVVAVPAPPSSERAPVETPSFDPEQSLRRLNNDRTLLGELIAIYESTGPQLLDQLRSALDAGDAPNVRSAAHTLRGSVCNFGAEDVVQLLRQMEMSARGGDLAGHAALIGELERKLDRLMGELRAWCGRPE